MSHNFFVRFLEIGLFAGFVLHIIQGLLLWKQNKAARKIKYHTNRPSPIVNGTAGLWACWELFSFYSW